MFASKHMPKEYAGKSTKPGMGGRMSMMIDDMMAEDPDMSMEHARKIAAARGREKYGVGKMAKWSAAGRKRNT